MCSKESIRLVGGTAGPQDTLGRPVTIRVLDTSGRRSGVPRPVDGKGKTPTLPIERGDWIVKVTWGRVRRWTAPEPQSLTTQTRDVGSLAFQPQLLKTNHLLYSHLLRLLFENSRTRTQKRRWFPVPVTSGPGVVHDSFPLSLHGSIDVSVGHNCGAGTREGREGGNEYREGGNLCTT